MISVWMIFASQQGLGGLSEAHILAPGHCETSKGLYLVSSQSLSPHGRHWSHSMVSGDDFIT